jgi:hypothetical protein
MWANIVGVSGERLLTASVRNENEHGMSMSVKGLVYGPRNRFDSRADYHCTLYM